MSDPTLPPDVRDKAAKKVAEVLFNRGHDTEREDDLAVVDAVAGVLAAHQSAERDGLKRVAQATGLSVYSSAEEVAGWITDAREAIVSHEIDAAATTQGIQEARADRDQLKAENTRLREAMDKIAGGPDVGARRCDCIQLKARVNVLTDALRSIADLPDVCLNAFDLGNDCPVCVARAALAAGEEKSDA